MYPASLLKTLIKSQPPPPPIIGPFVVAPTCIVDIRNSTRRPKPGRFTHL